MSKQRTHRTWQDRLLSGVLCLALMLGLLPAAGLVQTAEAAHWADACAEQLVEWEVMRPEWASDLNATVTRAEFVAMCNRAFGYTRLGEMPFTDVSTKDWYYDDINIAYNAHYLSGTSANPENPMASPNGTLTREQAVMIAGINLRLQPTVGESLKFTDSHTISDWSRGMVGSAVDAGVISGCADGSFQPLRDMTRGELAAMLVRIIGTPLMAAGDYELGEIYGNVVISSSNVKLRDTVILGDLYVTGGVDLGNVLLENVTVLGRIVIAGGGESDAAKSSVVLRNVTADEMVIDSLVNPFVTVSAYGLTQIPNTYVRSGAYLEDSCDAGHGLQRIELPENESGTKLQLAGSIKEVVNKTPRSLLQLVRGSAEVITVDEYAVGSELLVDINTRVDELNLDTGTYVYGEGDIIDLNIWAAGCVVDILPSRVSIRPGLTAVVAGKVIGSAAADELSADPRLLPGYPTVDSGSLRPTSAEGLYAANKPGTIYWAVSAYADGSVSKQDLLNNRAYGGNILKDGETPQSGSIDATAARREYDRLISGLEAGGSYYISAILVDERGNESPVKVISFTTPDDTVPAFVGDAPYMSKASCEVAQVTATANKSCRLYWVLLPAGVNAPTVSNFRTSNFGGNYGYGSISVVKNVPVSVQVNGSRLQENTGYDLYLWLCDFDGVMYSDVYKVVNKSGNASDPSFRTPDETPPVVLDVSQTRFDLPDAIEFSFEINEDDTTLYWAVVTATDTTFIKTTDDLTSQRVQLKVQGGTGSIVSGSMAAAGANVTTLVGSAAFRNALKYETYKTHNFKLYYVAKDAAGNFSAVDSITIHTVDNEPPTVTIDFSSAMYNKPEDKAAGLSPRPQANSDIILIFSEQVKGEGGEEATTFVELYDAVAALKDIYTDTGSAGNPLTAAKNALRDELKKHITLINVAGRNENKLKEPQRTAGGALSATQEEYGWVDFREAIVVLMADGQVALTLPGGTGVQLGGGMEYYFHFENIFDDSYTGNALMVEYADGTTSGGRNPGGINITECDSEHFTTVYAQVWLDPADEDIPKIDDTGNPNGLNDTRLDIVIDVTPQSVGSAVSDDRWDMVIWSDTSSEYNLYRRVKDSSGWSAWEKVNDDPIKGGKNIAVSLSAVKSDTFLGKKDKINDVTYDREQYETVKNGLLKDIVYEYGVCFTSINNEPWTDTTKEPEAWSELVTMRFSLVAGKRDNISNLSRSVDLQYDNYVKDGSVSEIGSVRSDTSTETILSISKQFTDKRPPAFMANSPTFDATSSTITMNVFLDRTGYLYYLAIPATEYFPYFKNGNNSVFIQSDTSYFSDGTGTPGNDGSFIDQGKVPSNQANPAASVGSYITGKGQGKTYIPLGGTDRDENGAHIYFVSGGNKTTAAAGAFNGIYTSPIYDNIFDGAALASGSQNAVAGSYQYTAKTTQSVLLGGEDAHNLKPDTWYYVYIVLRSDSGTFDDVVQVYRVKTKDVEPPVVIAGHYDEAVANSDGTKSTHVGVTMEITERSSDTKYDSPVLNYALLRKDNLPELLTQEFSSEGDSPNANSFTYPSGKTEMKVLEAMLTRSGRQTYFDLYATDAFKTEVMQYITQATGADKWGVWIKYYDQVGMDKLTETNPWPQDCTDQLTTAGEYILLACARSYYKDNAVGANFGFAAVQGLYKPDDVPPKLMVPSVAADGTGSITADISGHWRPEGNSTTWTRGYPDDLLGEKAIPALRWDYSGSIAITFDKAIYVYDGGVLKQVTDEDGDGTISILNVIGGTASVTSVAVNSDNTTFTLTFNRIRTGQYFTMNNLYNSSGSENGKSPETLVVTFETRLVGYEWSIDFRQVEAYFNVTWR